MFDRFAAKSSDFVARAPFFIACVALVVIWFPTLFIMSIDSSQLIINTATTIITFLLVALLQNTQDRAARAQNHKLDAIAHGMADVLDNTDGADGPGALAGELRRIAGIELESKED